MRRISHDTLRTRIHIKLSVLPGYVKRETGISGNTRERALDAIMSALAGCIIIAPSMIGFNSEWRQGRFGVDEPDPLPDLQEE